MPIPLFNAKMLRSSGLSSASFNPYYSEERADRHNLAFHNLRYLYQLGALLVNYNVGYRPDLMTQASLAIGDDGASLVQLTSAPAQSALAIEGATPAPVAAAGPLAKGASTTIIQATESGEENILMRHYESLEANGPLRALFLMKVALDHLPAETIYNEYCKQLQNIRLMTMGRYSSMKFPDGSFFEQHHALYAVLGCYLKLNENPEPGNICTNRVYQALRCKEFDYEISPDMDTRAFFDNCFADIVPYFATPKSLPSDYYRKWFEKCSAILTMDLATEANMSPARRELDKPTISPRAHSIFSSSRAAQAAPMLAIEDSRIARIREEIDLYTQKGEEEGVDATTNMHNKFFAFLLNDVINKNQTMNFPEAFASTIKENKGSMPEVCKMLKDFEKTLESEFSESPKPK